MQLLGKRKMMEETMFEESSGNIFADLGLENADEMLMRGKIGIQVIRLLKQRSLKQREIAELLEISQPEVSHLMKGEFQRFSEGKLLMFFQPAGKMEEWFKSVSEGTYKNLSEADLNAKRKEYGFVVIGGALTYLKQ